jgi:outer membrane protein assembly factor BamB
MSTRRVNNLLSKFFSLMMSAMKAFSLAMAAFVYSASASDQPQWGEKGSRNMISSERGLPESFNPATGRNVRWRAQIGTESHGTPIVAGGRVYIGTNNGHPRDPHHQGDRGVLMCFDEKDGHLLWQLVVPKREEDPYMDWPKSGLSSPVTVEGDRVYAMSSRGEVMCLDPKGMANGNKGPYLDEGLHMVPKGEARMEPGPLDADILWSFNLTSEAGIWSHDGAHSSILIHGDYLYVNSGTGVDNTHRKIRTPDAPSLIVIDKRTGKMVARDQEKIAPRIFHCTWSAPSLGTVNGRTLIFFCGGDGIVYAFEPVSKAPAKGEVAPLKKVWQFRFDPSGPSAEVHRFTTNRKEGPSNIYGMPVFIDGKIFVAGGGDIFWGKNEAWIKCIRADLQGDVTEKAEVWSYALEKHVMATPAIKDDLLFISDCGRRIHCLDARTGKPHWTHDIKGESWASPYIADGKVYLGTRAGEFYVFAASREKKLLNQQSLVTPISATTTAANGTLYLSTMTDLFALSTHSN